VSIIYHFCSFVCYPVVIPDSISPTANRILLCVMLCYATSGHLGKYHCIYIVYNPVFSSCGCHAVNLHCGIVGNTEICCTVRTMNDTHTASAYRDGSRVKFVVYLYVFRVQLLTVHNFFKI
jgi:hypothetical protein